MADVASAVFGLFASATSLFTGGSGCRASDIGSTMRDPVVEDALDDAWRDSHEGQPDEHEEGGFVYRCRRGTADGGYRYETVVQRFAPGAVDHAGVARGPDLADPDCRAVAYFHTHPGVGSDDPRSNDEYQNDSPSVEDYESSRRWGIPGIFRFGLGPDPAGTETQGFGEPEPRIPAWPCPTEPVATTRGEPHLQTFDGTSYDLQAPGDFVLVESTVDDLVVQARHELVPTVPSAPTYPVAVNTAVAVRLEGTVVELREDEAWVDGREVERDALAGTTTPGGGRVDVDAAAVTFTWADGSRVVVSGIRSVALRLADVRRGEVRGLLGDFDGDGGNDLTTPDGVEVVDRGAISVDRLQGEFADAWRVDPVESLIHGSPAGFPDEPLGPPLTAHHFPPGVLAAAFEVCRGAGVTVERLLADCAFDLAATGDESYAKDAAAAQQAIATLSQPATTGPDPPLVAAVSNGDAVTVGTLLADGADPDVRRPADGSTPLMIAAEIGSRQIVVALLAAGADLEATSPSGATALVYAARRGDVGVIEELLAAGADPVTPGRGWTALHAAAFAGHDPAVVMLLDAGAPLEAVDDRGFTPLVAAAVPGETSVVATLLEAGAEVDHEDANGSTALGWAVANGHVATVGALLAVGADPDHADADGTTPLHSAADTGHAELVEMLLDAGADPDPVDAGGARPRDLAERGGYDDVVALLEAAR